MGAGKGVAVVRLLLHRKNRREFMKALLFVQKIKALLRDVERSGGNPIFLVSVDHQLLNRLRLHAFRELQALDADDLRARQQFIDDLLSRDVFLARIRYSVVKLREFDIAENAYFGYISRAVDLQIQHPSKFSRIAEGSASCIDDWLVAEIARCFQPWYRPEDLFLYDFSQERQLICPDKHGKGWGVSNLGRYLLELSSFEAIAFLCALEIVMTLELHQNTFISMETLKHLLDSRRNGKPLNFQLVHPYSLRMFGILKGYFEGPREVSDFGYQVLSHIDANFGELRDVILILLESEATGFSYEPSTDFVELMRAAEESAILMDDQKSSIKKAIASYRAGSGLDGLRIMYPLIEGTLDAALRHLGIPLTGLNGIRLKVDKLAGKGVLTPDMSTTGEIISSGRNKVVHGNVLEEDDEIVRPLFILSVAYFQKLLGQLKRVL